MSDEPRPDRPTTEEDRYQHALRRVAALKEKEPLLHEAIIEVLSKPLRVQTRAFFDGNFSPVEAAKAHLIVNEVKSLIRIIENPVSFIKTPKKVPDGGGPRTDIRTLLEAGRRATAWVRDRMQPKKEGA